MRLIYFGTEKVHPRRGAETTSVELKLRCMLLKIVCHAPCLEDDVHPRPYDPNAKNCIYICMHISMVVRRN
ncbi:hypothetical protein DAI22_12g192950 [Oryza sativa Japonica Group]|nr:hypothetical protein DAI22_12g192950 [Oryza sativa Japonica Group]